MMMIMMIIIQLLYLEGEMRWNPRASKMRPQLELLLLWRFCSWLTWQFPHGKSLWVQLVSVLQPHQGLGCPSFVFGLGEVLPVCRHVGDKAWGHSKQSKESQTGKLQVSWWSLRGFVSWTHQYGIARCYLLDKISHWKSHLKAFQCTFAAFFNKVMRKKEKVLSNPRSRRWQQPGKSVL